MKEEETNMGLYSGLEAQGGIDLLKDAFFGDLGEASRTEPVSLRGGATFDDDDAALPARVRGGEERREASGARSPRRLTSSALR